jgi:hypothetical protein
LLIAASTNDRLGDDIRLWQILLQKSVQVCGEPRFRLADANLSESKAMMGRLQTAVDVGGGRAQTADVVGAAHDVQHIGIQR